MIGRGLHVLDTDAASVLVVWLPTIAPDPCDRCGRFGERWHPIYRIGPATFRLVHGQPIRCHDHLPEGALTR